MKVILYAVQPYRGQAWQWHISLDIAVDRYYWQKKGAVQLMATREISLGLAVTMQEQLGRGSRTEPHPQQVLAKCMKFHGYEQELELVVVRLQVVEVELSISIDKQLLDKICDSLAGRALLREELLQLLEHMDLDLRSISWRSYVQALVLRGDVTITNAVHKRRKLSIWGGVSKRVRHHCRRCGSGDKEMFWVDCSSCQVPCPYCESCLNMGRAKYCSLLVYGKQQSTLRLDKRSTPQKLPSRKWSLSAAQTEASTEALKFLHESSGPYTVPPRFLFWAVTGAGKTEMIFPLIESEINRGGNVLIATPRKDVVLELKPRLQKAFPEQRLIALYGGSDQSWQCGEITLATTHQLIRFSRKFDLVIIDELDAFPYHNNPMLEYAASQCCSTNGKYVLLSATPPEQLQRAIRKKQCSHVKVPVRFHGHPLPIPKKHSTKPLHKLKALPLALKRELQKSIGHGSQIFIFVPRIKLIEGIVQLVVTMFPELIVAGTSSQDSNRTDKVQAFRDGHIRILVTTTILERGVTVPQTDVFILGADSELFDEASLIQMAGRSGRSPVDPIGKVIFAAEHKTKAQVQAIRQLKHMNKIAKRKGYLKI